MKAIEVHVGGVYVAKVNNKLTAVRIEGSGHGGSGYRVRNLATNVVVNFRTAGRLRGHMPGAQRVTTYAELPLGHRFYFLGLTDDVRIKVTRDEFEVALGKCQSDAPLVAGDGGVRYCCFKNSDSKIAVVDCGPWVAVQ